MTASVLSLAPRLASTSARAAAPSRARRTGSPIRPTTASSSSRSDAHLHRGVVGEKRLRDLGEVLHVRTEHDRLAEDRRLEDVVAAGAAPGCRRRRRPSRSGRPRRARRSCRGSTASARGSASIGSSVRRTVDSPSCRHSRSTSPKRSGWRAAITSSASAALPVRPAEPLNARITASSSPLERAAGHEHRPIRRHAEEAKHALAAAAGRAGSRSSASNFRLPVTVMRAGSAPSSISRRARLLALHAERVDVGEHAPEERADQPVARERPVRDAAVHQHRLDAAARGTRAAGSARSRSRS